MVIPAWRAMARARDDADVRDMTIGMPIRAHFSTMSEVRRPVVYTAPRGGNAAKQNGADDLVHRVVAADILVKDLQSSRRTRGRSRAHNGF